MRHPPIAFYIHPKFWPRRPWPSSPDEPWSGFNFGIYTWSIQTALRLRQAGVDCSIVDSLPSEGIVLVHRECMVVEGARVRPGPNRLLVNLAADLDLYPEANLHVVQNPSQARWYPNCHWIMHWPEPGLVSRVAHAGDRFQNVAFVGNNKSLAPELQSEEWTATLARHGFRWIAMSGEFQYENPAKYRLGGAWTDYSDVDAIVAVRRFLPANAAAAFDHKPPSKLLNAWIAGVPAIVGHESAFRALRRGDLDFVEVCSPEETLQALLMLRDSPDLRRAMCGNGRARMPEVDANATVRRWVRFLEDAAIPAYERWIKLRRWHQHRVRLQNQFVHLGTRLRRKLWTSLNRAM